MHDSVDYTQLRKRSQAQKGNLAQITAIRLFHLVSLISNLIAVSYGCTV